MCALTCVGVCIGAEHEERELGDSRPDPKALGPAGLDSVELLKSLLMAGFKCEALNDPQSASSENFTIIKTRELH